jgi:hypothetical protein
VPDLLFCGQTVEGERENKNARLTPRRELAVRHQTPCKKPVWGQGDLDHKQSMLAFWLGSEVFVTVCWLGVFFFLVVFCSLLISERHFKTSTCVIVSFIILSFKSQ